MAIEIAGSDLPIQVITSLAAGVLAVPLMQRAGVGAIPAYILAGFIIGPLLGLVSDGETILRLAEIGVVLFLFLIGLEMEPRSLWRMRRDIFGTGTTQIVSGTFALAAIAFMLGFSIGAAALAALAFMLTSTATVVQLLKDRHLMMTKNGQGVLGILLFEDLLIVPLLLSVQLFAPSTSSGFEEFNFTNMAISAGSFCVLVVFARWGLTPLFQTVAATGNRDLMTGAALMAVLSVAFIMHSIGLSMALGAFLAGVVLSQSEFRLQLEADIEPFKGILLALFFLAVGMNIDAGALKDDFFLIFGMSALFMAVKSAIVYLAARMAGIDHLPAIERAAILAQGGEFGFVLIAAALGAELISPNTAAVLGAMTAISMGVTPIILRLVDPILTATVADPTELPAPRDDSSHVLIIGFGRFGQIVSQPLLESGYRITLIDTDGTMIQEAEEYGFKIYYGDGGRSDILDAAGAHTAKAIIICVDHPPTVVRISKMLTEKFSHVPIFVRAYDREHVLELAAVGVRNCVKETFESALLLAAQALQVLGETPDAAAEAIERIRRVDATRTVSEIHGGLNAGKAYIFGNTAARKWADGASPAETSEPQVGPPLADV